MDYNDPATIISVISGLGFLFLGYLEWRNKSNTGSADAAEKIGNAYSNLLDDQDKRIQRLDERLKFLENELRACMNWNIKLVGQLVDLGVEPAKRDTQPPFKALPKD